MKTQKQGFTVVELIIVIIVIAILATISYVSYNLVVRRANDSSAEASAKQAKELLDIKMLKNSEYPTDLATVGFSDSGSTKYEYTYSNSDNPKSYCVTVSVSGSSYYSSSTSDGPVKGLCPGHVGNAPSVPPVVLGIQHSVYGSSSPGTATLETESATTKVAASLYRRTSATDGWRVVGGRIYIPASAVSSLPNKVTMFWFYDTYSARANLATRVPVESKEISIKAGWNEVYWNTPYAINVGSSQRAWVGYTFGNNQYIKVDPVQLTIEASDGSPIKFADKGELRSDYLVGTTNGESGNTYGLDIIFDEGV